MWQYKFFNIILGTPINNIENEISEFNNNFLTLPSKNNKTIKLSEILQKNSSQYKNTNSATPPPFNKKKNIYSCKAMDTLEILLIEMGLSDFSVTFEYGEIYLTGNNGQTCFTIIVDSNSIYIDNLYKCILKGSESLQIVENLAIRMKNIIYISLTDLSDISILSSDKVINLPILKILTKGESWYNSLGYFSNDKTEKERNKLIIDGNYREFVFKLYTKLTGREKGEFPEIARICHKLYPPNYNQSVRNYFNHIWDEIKISKEKSKNNWFAEYLNIISPSILKYDRALIKIIRK
jgi:hypothetical protein